jgi:glycosyltransferase involved in cell wall biosynthesis
LKILFVIDTMTAGGKERRLTELMKSLKLKPDVQFELALTTNDFHYKEVYDLGINIHFFIRKSRKDLGVLRSFYRLCKNFKPDIVHCWDTMTAVYITPICKLLNIKLVNGMIVDAPKKQGFFFTPFLRGRLTFPFANIIIGNSRAGLIAYNAPLKKSIVIHNGFDFKRADDILPQRSVRELLNIKTEYIVGMVATFFELKDYPTYYEAAQIVLNKRRDVTFLAIGKKTDSTQSKNYISEKNTDHFRLLGKRSDIESIINIIDIGVLSTFTEGVSNSILEYMALGKPVIATDGGGTNEIVEDQKTGFLIRQSDPVELSEKIDMLLNDKQLRLEMGRCGKERIHKFFSIDVMTSKYYSAYQRLLVR